MRTAERAAQERGLEFTGLGVGDDNPRAAAHYARLGYPPTAAPVGRWALLDAEAGRLERADSCVFPAQALR